MMDDGADSIPKNKSEFVAQRLLERILASGLEPEAAWERNRTCWRFSTSVDRHCGRACGYWNRRVFWRCVRGPGAELS